MDHVSTGGAQREVLRHRRRRMREQARSHRAGVPQSEGYQTPEWLERSFVLPLTKPEATLVTTQDGPGQSLPGQSLPSQSVPHHDDVTDHVRRVIDGYVEPRTERPHQPATPPTTDEKAAPAPGFVRSTSIEIDFARVVRRADLCRRVTRLHWLATGLAGIALLLHLLRPSALLLVLVLVLAVVAVASFGVRLWLGRAPVPRLQR